MLHPVAFPRLQFATHSSSVGDSSNLGGIEGFKSKELKAYIGRSWKLTTHNIRRDGGNPSSTLLLRPVMRLPSGGL